MTRMKSWKMIRAIFLWEKMSHHQTSPHPITLILCIILMVIMFLTKYFMACKEIMRYHTLLWKQYIDAHRPSSMVCKSMPDSENQPYPRIPILCIAYRPTVLNN